MRTLANAALRLALLFVAAALAACGGGGGGGGGGAANPPAFSLTDSNALAASAVALRVMEQIGVASELPLVAAFELDTRRATQFSFPCGGSNVNLRNTDANADLRVSAGDTLSATHTTLCSGAPFRSISVRVSTVDLENYRLEGAADFDIESATGDRLLGTLSLATSVDRTSGQIAFLMTNITLTSVRDGKTERLSNARFDRRFDVAGRYSLDFSGQLDSGSLGGQYSFATPVRFAGYFGELPTAGELVATSGRTRARVAVSPSASPQQDAADYQIDAGSGYGPVTTVRWRELTGGLLFYWIPNDPPVITSFRLTPANPVVGTLVTATATATDPEGDSVAFEYRWTLEGQSYSSYGETQLLTAVHKGDRMTVTVTARDGRAEATRSITFEVGNAAPVVTSLTLDPAAPTSVDDLTAAAMIEDADGDSFTLRYEWQRNGVTIAGVTGSTLPRSAFAKGDTVVAIAHVSDGSATVSQQVSVTIADALPRLTWLSPVTTVAHGALLSARAVATDPDGEALPSSLRFELRYGPAGMSVDATTGVVSWLARGPMFERSMDVRYGVGTNIQGTETVAATVTVQDPNRQYPLARSSLDPGQYYSNLRAGDFDGDGDAEMLLLTRGGVLYELEAAGSTYRQSWMYPFGWSVAPLAFATADIDADGAHEIFVASGDRVLRLDGVARRVTASATLAATMPPYLPSCADLETADLDRDGTIELVCSATLFGFPDAGVNNPLIVFDAATLAVERQVEGYFGNDMAIGNVDNDPALEIVTWRGYVIDGVTLQQEWVSAETFGSGVAVGDVTGDSIAEIVAGYGNASGTVGRIFSAVSKSTLAELPHLGYTTNVIANIDGTGRPEILMAGSRFAAYRYNGPGSVTTVFSMVLPNDKGATTLAVANVDRAQDARVEFVLGTNQDSIEIADFPAGGIRIEWSSANLEPAVPQTLSGPFFGGQLARSPAVAPRPLFMTPQTGFRGARLFTLNPANGDLTYSPEIPQGDAWWDPADLVVTDFDNDGTDEAFISVADRIDSAVGAYEFFAGQLRFRSPILPDGPVVDIDRGDFNGDGSDDLVALTANGGLRVYDVVGGGALLWSETIPPGGSAVAVANLDGAGLPEIIATTYQQVIVFARASPTAPFVRRYETALFDYGGDMTVGDVDGDGLAEIFFMFDSPRIVQRFNHRLEPGTRFFLPWTAESLSIEASAFGRKNLVATYYDPAGSELRILDPVLGEEIWRSPPIPGAFAPNSIHFVDIAGDGVLRLAFGTSSGVFLTR